MFRCELYQWRGIGTVSSDRSTVIEQSLREALYTRQPTGG